MTITDMVLLPDSKRGSQQGRIHGRQVIKIHINDLNRTCPVNQRHKGMLAIGKHAPQNQPLVSDGFRRTAMGPGYSGIDMINANAAAAQDVVI